jgi:hypothetical protein
MANIAVVPKKVRRHPETRIRDMDAGGGGNVGDYVYIAADGDAEQADGSAAPAAHGFGIVISVTGNKTTFVAGDRLAVAYEGPVSGFSGMTPGDILYSSDDAGLLADAAGTVSHKAARALSAETLLLVPQLTEA